ncbi:MAG TPA: metalloregulator ArsR/SmtB family transcription factor [Steroidobacteraceae bacterium]|nr:metalloregulator ArsR/SmtB family transcription factor [Steroidobacteraceae bacterium]
MSSNDPKLKLFAGLAEVGRALGNEHRLRILELLAQRATSVEALAERVGLSVANASQHLRVLRAAGLLTSRREGKRVLYGLSDPTVLGLTRALGQVAERNLAQVREVVNDYLRARDAFEPISRNEVRRRLKDDLVTLLDVRPDDEFAAGHLPNAINIPLRDLPRRLRELPRNREIVAYCRGAYCVLAYEAVALLRKRGFTAVRLEDGFPEWRAAGLPVEALETR